MLWTIAPPHDYRPFLLSCELFGAVFVLEAGLFVVAAAMALKTIDGVQSASAASMVPGE